jgi:hypothetical protein
MHCVRGAYRPTKREFTQTLNILQACTRRFRAAKDATATIFRACALLLQCCRNGSYCRLNRRLRMLRVPCAGNHCAHPAQHSFFYYRLFFAPPPPAKRPPRLVVTLYGLVHINEIEK